MSNQSNFNVSTKCDPNPNEIIFYVCEGKWAMKINKEGVFFNREDFPNFKPDDFCKSVIDVFEKNFTVKFEKKNKE